MQLEVVDYLRQNSIQKLQEEFGIKVKEYGAEGLNPFFGLLLIFYV
jgi:hypothetical protein